MRKSSIASSKNRAWTEWLLPSTSDLIFVAFLSVLVFTNLSVRLLGDSGIGWHIRTGQLILANHAISHTDPFSSSMTGQSWFAWEWLYDVSVGWLERIAGLNGVVLFTAIVIAATFSWIFRLLMRRGASFPVALLLVLLAASASMIHFFARPHVITWLFCLLWVWVLDRFGQDRRLLLLLPLSMLLWVNIHGGFLLGFAILGIYWLSAVWQSLRINEDHFGDFLAKLRAGKQARDLTGIAFLSAATTFVNPYGWSLHIHIYRYLSNRFLMDHIDEFQSPNFHGVAQKCFALLLLLALMAFAAKRSEPSQNRPAELLLVLFAAYSGLYAARNIPVASLLLIWVTAPKLSRTLHSVSERLVRETSARNDGTESFFVRMQTIDASLCGHLWPVAVIAISCGIAFNGGRAGGRSLMNAHFNAERFPVAAVDYLELHNMPGPTFAPDSWGGYLIYRFYPERKVVIDDRHDFYGEEFLKSYLKTIHVEPGWQDFLLNQNPAAIMVPRNSALASILRETPRWQPVYADETAIIFTLMPAKPEASWLQLPSH